MAWGRIRLVIFCSIGVIVASLGAFSFWHLFLKSNLVITHGRFYVHPQENEVFIINHKVGPTWDEASSWDVKLNGGSIFRRDSLEELDQRVERGDAPFSLGQETYTPEQVAAIQKDLLELQSISPNQNYFCKDSLEIDFQLNQKLYRYDFPQRPFPDLVVRLCGKLRVDPNFSAYRSSN